MAAKPFSKEQLNFFKFSTLVLDEFPKVLREIFVTMWDSKVSMKPGFIPWDDSITVRNLLLTSEGGKTDIPTGKSINEWDCTALFKATIYAKTFGAPSSKGSTLNDLYLKKVKPVPGSFHSSVQSSTGNQDETYALAIDQLRLLRNKLCHSPKSEIVKTDFDVYVQLVINALTALKIDTSVVDVIGQMSEDDFPTEKVQKLEECRIKELQVISMFHENIEQKLSSIEEWTGTQMEKMENVEQMMKKLNLVEKGNIAVVEKQTEKIENVEQMIKKLNLVEKGNIAETLPKPYVPSPVPFFTGRDVEIEEITNLITDQSTRLLNIWGSPGFGKTSTAIGAAHHLVSLGYPVYFFKLQGINTVDDFLSKLLGIFKCSLVDHGLKPIDKLVSIFREISCPVFLIFDNLDDLLSVESGSATLSRLFVELLDTNANINIICTTREILDNTCVQINGFQNIRIRPLHPVSSVKFVRQLLPKISEYVVAKVAEICSHVPLAMKLVAPLLENNTEDMANKKLEDLNRAGNLFERIDSPYEKNMKNLFEIPFEQLTLTHKHALISLTVFRSSRISKDAVVEVLSAEIGVVEGERCLKTLVKKSLIDEDSSGENYSMHPLIHSFVVEKAKGSDFQNVLNSSRLHFCSYYLLLFEKFNDDFLAGKSIASPQLQDTLEHLPIAMGQSLTIILQDLVRILSKCEIFLFLIGLPCESLVFIPNLYDAAIEKSITQEYVCSKLYVSKYFGRIVFSFFVEDIYSDIPEQIREDVLLSSDGSVAKLGCYEGISLILKENRKLGVEQIEKHLDGLSERPDQQFIKCLCLQLLCLCYTDLKEDSKSNDFSRKASEVCDEIGNRSLFLICDCEQSSLSGQNESKGEQLILFIHLLFFWSKAFVSDETTTQFLDVLHSLEQQLDNKPLGNSHYLFSVVMYSDNISGILCKIAKKEFLLDEKIILLDKSLKSELSTFPSFSHQVRPQLSQRLFNCYTLKLNMEDEMYPQKNVDKVETCRNALDLSLQLNGKQHKDTAFCYFKLGHAETAAENYSAALDAFDQVIEISEITDDGIDILAKAFFEKGGVYSYMNKSELAIESVEEALRLRRKSSGEDTKEIAEVLFRLGMAQYQFNDFTSALAKFRQALEICLKLSADKRCPLNVVIMCYNAIARVHDYLGNKTESLNVLQTQLQLGVDCNDERVQLAICDQILDMEVDEKLYPELFDSATHAIKEENKPFLKIFHLKLAAKKFKSGNYNSGLASLKKAFNITLDKIMLGDVYLRNGIIEWYRVIVRTLVEVGKFKLAGEVIERATKIAESLPECRKHPSIFRCHVLKGRVFNEMGEYDAAIESLGHALLQLPKLSHDVIDKFEEFECRHELAIAYWFKESYEKALTSYYDALSVVKDISPEGSEGEGDLYLAVAAIASRIKNKSLVVNNLRLAYRMYSKILGRNHPKTELCYIDYARALINC